MHKHADAFQSRILHLSFVHLGLLGQQALEETVEVFVRRFQNASSCPSPLSRSDGDHQSVFAPCYDSLMLTPALLTSASVTMATSYSAYSSESLSTSSMTARRSRPSAHLDLIARMTVSKCSGSEMAP